MKLNTILVYLESEERAKKCLDIALDLANRHDAHLIGLTVAGPIYMPSYASSHIPSDVYSTLEDNQRDGLNLLKTLFENKVRASGRESRSEWREVKGDPTAVLSTRARMADLVILGQEEKDKDSPSYIGLPDTVILDAGRPVLVVPSIGTIHPIGASVMVGWNNTREAARAVSDALPILQQASNVEVLSVNSKRDDDVPGADLARYLSEAGVKAELTKLTSKSLSVADLFLDQAADKGHDLIVIGGYGHQRIREMIMGGVTRDLLQQMTVPVMFSH